MRTRRPARAGRGAGLGGEADRGDPGGRAGGDDLGGRARIEPVVGNQADAERPAVQKLDVAAEAPAQGGQVGQVASPSRRALRSPRSSDSARRSRSFSRSVSTSDADRRAGALPSDAAGKAAGVAGRSRSMWVSADGGLEGQDEEGQELESHVEHRRHGERRHRRADRAGIAATGAHGSATVRRSSVASGPDKISPIPDRPQCSWPPLRKTTRLKWAKPFSWASARVRRTAAVRRGAVGPEDHHGRRSSSARRPGCPRVSRPARRSLACWAHHADCGRLVEHLAADPQAALGVEHHRQAVERQVRPGNAAGASGSRTLVEPSS